MEVGLHICPRNLNGSAATCGTRCDGQGTAGVDVVYHLAAYQDYLPDFSRFINVNSSSTALIYELIVGQGLPVRKVIVASSQAVLGEGLYHCPNHGQVSRTAVLASNSKPPNGICGVPTAKAR